MTCLRGSGPIAATVVSASSKEGHVRVRGWAWGERGVSVRREGCTLGPVLLSA